MIPIQGAGQGAYPDTGASSEGGEVGGDRLEVKPSADHLMQVQHSTAQYSTVQYSAVQYSTVQYSTVQYSTPAAAPPGS